MSDKLSSDDPIETLIGRFGKYQTWILFLVTIGRLPTEFQLNNVVFVIPGVKYTCLDENAYNGTNVCPCENPLYDQTDVVSSVTTEWGLICGRRSLASLAQSMMQFGILVGSLIYGHVADRYGRKQGAVLSMTVEVLFIILSAVVPNLWTFLICRFLIGTSVGGVMLCYYVLIVELSGKSFRPYVIGLQEIAFVLGYFTLPIIAYYIREWRYLQLVTSVPWILTLSFYWLIPESPRWLITTGRTDRAIELLTRIAKRNNRPTDNIETVVNKVYEDSIKDMTQGISYLDLFRTPKIRKYTIIIAFIWMFCAATFFGINQYIGRLEGNLYINVMIAAACHAPGIVFVIIATLHFKRKVSVITSFSVAAISLLVFIFVSYSMRAVYLAFAIIGQIGAYTSFMQVYLYSSEVFPTVVRNSAMGFASVFARTGGFAAPFVVNIGIEWASILVFSGLSFCAAILCCFLPETKGIVLLNTIYETEQSNMQNQYTSELIAQNK